MFSNRRQLRRWAAQLLLLWLFGVSAGVANACWAGSLAKLGAQDLHTSRLEAMQRDQAPPECEMHAASHQAQDGDGASHPLSHTQSTCQTYCDMSTLSFSPLKSSLDDSPGPALAAPTYALALPVAGDSPVHLLMPRRDGGLAPPITIAFLRLTL